MRRDVRRPTKLYLFFILYAKIQYILPIPRLSVLTKIGVNLTGNHIDSIFRGKISIIYLLFSGLPFSDLQNSESHLHAPALPLQVFVNSHLNSTSFERNVWRHPQTHLQYGGRRAMQDAPPVFEFHGRYRPRR